MRYFSLVDSQYEMLALFLGLAGLILVYMAWASYPLRGEKKTPEELSDLMEHEIDGGLSAKENPLAPFLWFIYVGLLFWAIAYIVYAAVRGQPVGY